MSQLRSSRRMAVETARPLAGRAALPPFVATVAAALGRRGPLLGVFALYFLALLIIPVMTPVAIGDDWVYARSVEILLDEGRVRILDLSVVTLIWQVLWGGLFAAVLGPTFGAMRLSTVVITALGGLACYGCCRQLGVERGRAALGAALYLFNPLLFSISYSFMSDAHFVALLTIAAYCYLRGLRPDAPDARFVVAGSFVAGLAFLERQQGALIPLAVATYLALAGRLRPDRAGVALFARVVALPAAMTIAYYLWFRFIHGIPKAQGDFLKKVQDAGIDGAILLVSRLSIIEATYVGLFVLPLALAALLALPGILRAMSPPGWLAFSVWALFVVGGTAIFWASGRRMPYIPHYLSPHGVGSYDLRGGRPWLIGQLGLDIATIVCAAGALIFGLILCTRIRNIEWRMKKERGGSTRAVAGTTTAEVPVNSTFSILHSQFPRSGAALTLALAFWQIVGVLPQSFTFRNWTFRGYNAPSLDRYLLPLLPLAIMLALWALRETRIAIPAAWALALAMALFSIVGTRDFLTFHTAVWDLARQMRAEGVPLTKLDAGAAWDGYHLYEYSIANDIHTTAPLPWWLGLFAPANTAEYIIAGAPRDDFSELYAPIRRVEYSTWLNPEPTYLYVLRRKDVPGPP
jgi:4-amino-4-deoxy-L-arabinose transferase-like glycosyltransferase